MSTTFGQIRIGEHFLFNGKEWKRTRGRFALPASQLGEGQAGQPFDLKTPVVSIQQ